MKRPNCVERTEIKAGKLELESYDPREKDTRGAKGAVFFHPGARKALLELEDRVLERAGEQARWSGRAGPDPWPTQG